MPAHDPACQARLQGVASVFLCRPLDKYETVLTSEMRLGDHREVTILCRHKIWLTERTRLDVESSGTQFRGRLIREVNEENLWLRVTGFENGIGHVAPYFRQASSSSSTFTASFAKSHSNRTLSPTVSATSQMLSAVSAME